MLIGVLGLARSGRAAAELALSRGHQVFASDAGDSPELREAADAVRALGGEAETGGHTVERLAECTLLVVSPGIAPTAPVLMDARLDSVRRVSELEFAFWHLRAPVIAVTGTNGKTTTTALTAHLLRAAGRIAPAAGNIGLALSEVAQDPEAPDWVVVEASSFQLAGTETFAPRIGMVTNLSPDHLDRYASVEAYYADKARLFANAEATSSWILNGWQPEVLALADGVAGRRLYVWAGDAPEARGETPDPESGLDGGYVADGRLKARLDGRELDLVGADQLRLLGRHNQANALFAALAALVAGAEPEAIRQGLMSFAPLPHRLQPVADVGGVLWINDSKATNLDSTRVALRSMTRPTVLLLGGRHKGEPYTHLLPEIRQHVKAVIGFGEAAPVVEADLRHHIPVERVNGAFAEALERAAAQSAPGDVVLLSPACSSYDMFRDYEDRGEQFQRMVLTRAGEMEDSGGPERSGDDHAA
jgi:UDP-N-acetylmuramoylalanine--D-glutamate ligase